MPPYAAHIDPHRGAHNNRASLSISESIVKHTPDCCPWSKNPFSCLLIDCSHRTVRKWKCHRKRCAGESLIAAESRWASGRSQERGHGVCGGCTVQHGNTSQIHRMFEVEENVHNNFLKIDLFSVQLQFTPKNVKIKVDLTRKVTKNSHEYYILGNCMHHLFCTCCLVCLSWCEDIHLEFQNHSHYCCS